MTKREQLKLIAEEHIDKDLYVDDFWKNYPQFFYKPNVAEAADELDVNLIEGLLWDYKVTFKMVESGDCTYRKKAISAKIKKLSKTDKKKHFYVFMSLAQPNDEGKAEVDKETFESAGLHLGNGGSWCRGSSKLAKIFIVNRKKERGGDEKTITSVELCGWNREIQFSQRIRKDIKDKLDEMPCVIFGIKGFSENTAIEIDHKDGRKDDSAYNDVAAQKEEWFQPLCKAANDIKRHKCQECKKTNKRWSASNIPGYEDFPYYIGDSNYDEKFKCEGCYLYDPVAFRQAYKEFLEKGHK